MFVPSTLFEEMGFHYTGPIDGHDVPALVAALKTLKSLKGPQLLHVITTKGKGYELAEGDQIGYHAVVAVRSRARAWSAKAGAKKPTYTDVFGDWLCDMAAADPQAARASRRRCAKARAWCASARNIPSAISTSAIAEQHAVTLAAGMACEGAKPVVAIYSTFLQRGYDQLVHDVAIQNLDVLFAIDRGGVVGPDGATHAGNFDLSLPALRAEHGGDGAGRRERMPADADHRLPSRRPGRGALSARHAARAWRVQPTLDTLPIGKARSCAAHGSRVALLAFGAIVPRRRSRSARSSA